MQVTATCKWCGHNLAPVKCDDKATVTVKRTCRKCRTVWQVICTPAVVSGLGVVHELTYNLQ